nr:glutamine--fructose-6-phosphate transaminase (isomerizing) [Desulfobacterales bacterium]
MCGIIGYVGKKDAVPLLMDGLRRLEYRGYDSAGIAVIGDKKVEVRRCLGKIAKLEELLLKRPIRGEIGMGHTRWATHGVPSDTNAHPHRAGSVVVVHNGIIENYLKIKSSLIKKGRQFISETDTEIIAHLIDEEILKGSSFEEAVRSTLAMVEGSYALLVMNEKEPELLIAAKKESPLVLGMGEEEYFVASDIPAILNYTRRVRFLDDGDITILSPYGVTIKDQKGNLVERRDEIINWTPVMAEKAGYKHFMLKEIFEQPRAVLDTFRGRIQQEKGVVFFEGLNIGPDILEKIKKIVIVACGTSWHAALVGKFLLEAYCEIPVEVDIGSEFRYRDPLVDKDTLLIAISQSGETADTLASAREGKKKGARLLAICNVMGSSLVRYVDGVIYTRAGPEIGVASTKAFTTQLTVLYLLTIHLGRIRRKITKSHGQEMIQALMQLPHLMEKVLEQDQAIKELAKKYSKAQNFLYLGRNIYYPIALEGALKLKEISYIHAEGYPAGEMKHGPIALIDETMPVVVLAMMGPAYDKIVNNIEEVQARGGKVIALCDHDNHEIEAKVADVLKVPSSTPELMPILSSIPLQLFAYHVAVIRGTDVDQPRNLAKSVTVE